MEIFLNSRYNRGSGPETNGRTRFTLSPTTSTPTLCLGTLNVTCAPNGYANNHNAYDSNYKRARASFLLKCTRFLSRRLQGAQLNTIPMSAMFDFPDLSILDLDNNALSGHPIPNTINAQRMPRLEILCVYFIVVVQQSCCRVFIGLNMWNEFYCDTCLTVHFCILRALQHFENRCMQHV